MVSCAQGYFLVDFWGHGISSSAFYFSRVDAWSRILFAAVNLAQDMGLEGEAVDIVKRPEHIRAVYESQMQ